MLVHKQFSVLLHNVYVLIRNNKMKVFNIKLTKKVYFGIIMGMLNINEIICTHILHTNQTSMKNITHLLFNF